MLKKMLLIAAGLFLLLPLQAQTQKMKSEYVFAKVYRAEKNPANYKDPAQAKALLAKREACVAALGALKIKLVRENAALAKLQSEFDSCLKKMAVTLSGRESVRNVHGRIASLEKEAAALPGSLADKEKKLASAREAVKSSDAKVASEGFQAVEKLEKEIAALKKKISGIPARRTALEQELRENMRKECRPGLIPEVDRMSAIAEEMTLIIESTEEAKKINRDLKAIDAELNKLVKK